MNNADTLQTIRELLDLSLLLEKKILKSTAGNPAIVLTPLQMKTLTIISEKGHINMTNLAKELIISKQQCTVIVNTLSKKGYIIRHINPRNRREILLKITDSALEILEDVNTHIENTLYDYYDSLSQNDKNRFMEASKTIEDILNKVN